MKTSRRLLLQLLGATAATAAAPRAFATTPGQLTPSTVAGSPRRVLEIFLRGGASQFSSFWYDATLGADSDGPGGGTGSGTGDTSLTDSDWINKITASTAPNRRGFGGHFIGKAGSPLFDASPSGKKLSDHMRVLRVRHDLLPHEAAIPYAMTGTRLGRPNLSGLGAAINRLQTESTGTFKIRSLILQAGFLAGEDLAAGYAAAYGLHGAMFRPPIVKLGNPDFYTALDRNGDSDGVGTGPDYTKSDLLKKLYRDRFTSLLTAASYGLVRSNGFSAYDASFTTMTDYAGALQGILQPSKDLLFPSTPITTPNYHDTNLTRNAITAAVQMLTAADSDVRHVCVVDGGVESTYDTHAYNGADSPIPVYHNGNIWNVCDTLRQNADTLLDKKILVLIHSEFGRRQDGGGNGTEHHTKGYANVVISDLITSPGFKGTISSDGLEAQYAMGNLDGLSPTDVHAAVAQLAGIEPWQNDMYDGDLSCLGDLSAPASELLLT